MVPFLASDTNTIKWLKKYGYYTLINASDYIVESASLFNNSNGSSLDISRSLKGKTLEETRKEVGMVIESIDNIDVAYELGRLHNIEMPIVETVYRVLYESLDPQEAVKDLMTRDKKME